MSMEGMKSYKNNELGFEIEIPDQWPGPKRVAKNTLLFNRSPIEIFNFVIGPILPERLLEYTEFEFRQYAQRKKHTDLEFGRIAVEGKDHVWARYCMVDGNWAKKYLIVFGRVEYAITGICTNKNTLSEREAIWDTIVKSFRISEWRQQNADEIDARRKRVAGELFAKAYDVAALGHYEEACSLLKKCIAENPNHILAHKELAFVLKNTGDVKGALPHRQKVKQLDPSDSVNRFNLAGIYAMLGKLDDALGELDELLKIEPENSIYLKLKKAIEDGLF